MITVSNQIRVRYSETDKMGIVYHGNYLVWFEIGRIHLLDEIGFPYSQIEEMEYWLPVLEVHAAYHRSVEFDDRIDIATSLRDLPRLRLSIDYELTRNTEVICTGSTKHAFLNAAGKVVRPPSVFVEHLKSVWL